MKTMFKKAGRIALASAMTVSLLGVGSAFAQPPITKFNGYTSGVQVANISDQSATVTLTAYKEDGTVGGTSNPPDTIAPGASKTYFPVPFVQSGFKGSIVVSANQNVAAISNILDTGFIASGSYVGRSAGGTTVLLPLLMKDNGAAPNLITTWYSVQNAGTADATVNVAYSDGTTANATIKAGAAKAFYQSQETHSAKVFAGTVTSNQPVVVAAIQEDGKVIFAYTGFTGGVPNPVFPLVNANNNKIITGIQIQNAGDQATSVTLTYSPSSAGAQCTETQNINPKASATFALAAFANGANSTCKAGDKFVGAAKVTANSTNQPLVGIGNQLLPGANGGAYSSFGDTDAGASVALPLIMDRNSGFFTGFSIQNIGATTVRVDCKFSNSSYTIGADVAAGAALVDLQANKIAAGYVGSATCSSTDTTAKLVGVVNQLGPNLTRDQLAVYEGVKK